MKAKPLPAAEFLRECLAYCAETGALTWKHRPLSHFKNAHAMNTFNANYAGRQCSANHGGGYVTATIDCRHFQAHRLIWKMVTGADPAVHIDHINGKADDNRWANLREATHQQNSVNRGASVRSKTGLKGVVFDAGRGKYAAYITVNGKSKFAGRHSTAEAASAARFAAEAAAHGQFAFRHSQEQA